MADEVTKMLENLRGEKPKAAENLSEKEKDALVAKVGPRTASAIVKAKKDFPLARIMFLFSAVDSQAVADVLANDVAAAITRALKATTKA